MNLKSALLLFVLFGTISLSAQTVANNEEKVEVESFPEFPGGEDNLISYLMTSVIYPEYALKNKIEGTVIVEFTVTENGHIKNARVIKSPDECLNDESLRVINAMPLWIPGKDKEGNPISVFYTIPITYRLY